MKIALAASLQGAPEEPAANAIVSALLTLLTEMYPGHEVRPFWRASGYVGDAYAQVWRDINAWGADLAVHIHLDAGDSGARGFSVLFCHDTILAAEIYEALLSLRKDHGVKDRGMVPRCDVAVLNRANQPATLIECGFYTSPEDMAIAPYVWASYISIGLEAYIGRTRGIWPAEDKEDEGMNLELLRDSGGNPVKDDDGLFVFGVAARKPQTLMAYARSAADVAAKLYFVPTTGPVIVKDWPLGGWNNGDGKGNHGTYYALANFADLPEQFFLEIHVPTTELYGGVF